MPRWTARAVPENVRWLRDEAADAALRGGLARWQADEVRLAVSEAVSNVVRHAYPEGEPGLVGVTAGWEDEDLLVEVDDLGIGMRQGMGADVPQLGMTVMAALSAVQVTSPPEGGVRVAMRFGRLAGRPDLNRKR